MASPQTQTSLPLITVLGSLNMDLVSYVPHHPLPGETLTSSSFAVSPGGKGANQAIACAKLSRPRPGAGDSAAAAAATAAVRMVGAVGGADSYGAQLRRNLAAHGVDVSGVAVRPSPAKTGLAIIVVDEPTGENRIILSPESNHTLDSGAIEVALGSSSSSSGRPALLIMQLEVPLHIVTAALAAARDRGVPVLLNPAPAPAPTGDGALPDDALRGLEHLVLNETEAAALGGVPETTLETEEGLRAVAEGFAAKGVRNVVVTLGGRGVYYYCCLRDGDGVGPRSALVPAEKAVVVDTTAAGDTFVGMYALAAVAASSRGEPFDVEAAVRAANRAAAKTVERKGAQDSIPWLDELVQ